MKLSGNDYYIKVMNLTEFGDVGPNSSPFIAKNEPKMAQFSKWRLESSNFDETFRE